MTDALGLAPNYQFYLGERGFVADHPELTAALIASIQEIGRWISANVDQAAAELSPSTGIPADALELAISRQSFGVAPLDQKVIDDQQAVADTFKKLGLLPEPIRISDAVANGT